MGEVEVAFPQTLLPYFDFQPRDLFDLCSLLSFVLFVQGQAAIDRDDYSWVFLDVVRTDDGIFIPDAAGYEGYRDFLPGFFVKDGGAVLIPLDDWLVEPGKTGLSLLDGLQEIQHRI